MNVAELEKALFSSSAFKLVAPKSIPMTPEITSPNHDRIGISKTASPTKAASPPVGRPSARFSNPSELVEAKKTFVK